MDTSTRAHEGAEGAGAPASIPKLLVPVRKTQPPWNRLLLSEQNTHPPLGGGGWVYGWVGGLAPNFSILGHQPPPPPLRRGAGALFGGFEFVPGSEIGLNFSLFFLITCQTS